ncbi:hypothetical protein [Leptospira vanthielii]|uniref:DUF4129 domain-containing protein n=1 Tax=Leptospira vanthielii TaxID=293085 RepID=A0ABY2NKC5_9LEPT|nr:hypothetical protein [Leptospira vanthielii]TGM45968.1 hypothetical protein EHQ95_17630 [Leptospira vanthielii]
MKYLIELLKTKESLLTLIYLILDKTYEWNKTSINEKIPIFAESTIQFLISNSSYVLICILLLNIIYLRKRLENQPKNTKFRYKRKYLKNIINTNNFNKLVPLIWFIHAKRYITPEIQFQNYDNYAHTILFREYIENGIISKSENLSLNGESYEINSEAYKDIELYSSSLNQENLFKLNNEYRTSSWDKLISRYNIYQKPTSHNSN